MRQGLPLQSHLPHRRLVAFSQSPVHGDMLIRIIWSEGSLGMPRDELQFGIRQPGGLGQEGDALVSETMGGALNTSPLRPVCFTDLLDAAGGETPAPPGLEQVASTT